MIRHEVSMNYREIIKAAGEDYRLLEREKDAIVKSFYNSGGLPLFNRKSCLKYRFYGLEEFEILTKYDEINEIEFFLLYKGSVIDYFK